MSLQIVDTLTNQTKVLNEQVIRWYTCGPTVYDDSHLGHARTYMNIDLIRRAMILMGKKVILGMNITDIDDKIINKANDLKTDTKAVSEKYTDLFFRDMLSLNVMMPDITMKVTDHIASMINDIKKMIDIGVAYQRDGSVFMDHKAYLEKGIPFPKFTKTCGDENDEANKDFVLWKSRDKATQFGYDSPFGFGVIGWHTECVTLSRLMFPNITIHSGGIDLAFPHHHNEMMQNNALGYKVDNFMHIGHLDIVGRKMAKSLKNFITIKDLLKKYTADNIRMYFMIHHYSSRQDFSESGIEEAKIILEYITNFINTYIQRNTKQPIIDFSDNKIIGLVNNLDEFIRNDFNFPAFVKEVYSVIGAINSGKLQIKIIEVAQFIEYLKKTFNGLGFVLSSSDKTDLLVSKITDFRSSYRSLLKKDTDTKSLKKALFEESDKFRAEVANIGIKLEDTIILK